MSFPPTAPRLLLGAAASLVLCVGSLGAQERPEAAGIEAAVVSDHPLASAAGAQVLWNVWDRARADARDGEDPGPGLARASSGVMRATRREG